MAAWAYVCHPPGRADEPWYVSCLAADALPTGTVIVRVQVDGDWRCARLDRRERLAIDSMLLRDVVASDEADCPECRRAAAPPAEPAAASAPAAGRELQAAAMSLQGRRFVVVLVSLDLVQRAGEADMAASDLKPRFGGVDVVLMGQEDDGTPVYHGPADVLAGLNHVPVDRMPWKTYTVG